MMTRFLLKLALLFILLLTITSLAARALGSTQPPNPALRGFTEGCQDKPQPCWYGIVPGNTNVEDAHKQLVSEGYKLYTARENALFYSNEEDSDTKSQFCSSLRLLLSEGKLTVLEIFSAICHDILLGDLSLVGLPEKVLSGSLKVGRYYTAEILVDQPYWRGEWSPNSQMQSFNIASSAFDSYSDVDFHLWRGFLPHWRYCQLEPQYQDCP